MNDQVLLAGKTLWDYMKLHQPVVDADCLLVIGSLNDSVAIEAARLDKEFRFKTIVISGGKSRIERTRALGWGEDSEAEHYLKVMLQAGCMREDIILEQNAANTGENANQTYQLLQQQGTIPESLIVLTKPYMERRASATFDIQWPDKQTKITYTSPDSTLLEYCKTKDQLDYTLHIMVGDLQRIIEYPELGYQSKQLVPSVVMDAYSDLKMAGFTKHLM